MSRPVVLDLFPGLPERIASRVEVVPSGCWVWRGWRNNLGYGYTRWEGRDRPVHRLFMEWLGRVRDGEDVDHLCGNPSCCNPLHLEGVAHRENIRRGRAAQKVACKFGHDWTDARNVYVRRDGRRWCAACARERWS